jgi:hypothetical protein
MTCTDQISSAVPGAIDPKPLFHHYQKKLIQSLKVYLGNMMTTFKVDFVFLIDKLEALDASKRLSPALFSAYVRMKEAYEKKNIQDSLDAVQFLRVVLDRECYCPQRTFGTILSEPWEEPHVRDLRNSNPTDDFGKPLAKSIQMLPLSFWKDEAFPPKELMEAEHLIEELNPALWDEYETYVSSVKLFSSRTIQGATSPRFFGNIYLRLPYSSEDPVFFYLEHLVHELSHLHLYAMMAEDPLFLNEATELFTSPLRPDKRPMMGIFHATFVLARIASIFRSYVEKYPLNEEAKEILRKTEKAFSEGYQIVSTQAKLTERGRDIVESLSMTAFG